MCCHVGRRDRLVDGRCRELARQVDRRAGPGDAGFEGARPRRQCWRRFSSRSAARSAAVRGFPHAPAGRAHVEVRWLAQPRRERRHAPGVIRRPNDCHGNQLDGDADVIVVCFRRCQWRAFDGVVNAMSSTSNPSMPLGAPGLGSRRTRADGIQSGASRRYNQLQPRSILCSRASRRMPTLAANTDCRTLTVGV